MNERIKDINTYDLNDLNREELIQLISLVNTVMSNTGRIEREIGEFETKISGIKERVSRMHPYLTFGEGMCWFLASIGITGFLYFIATIVKAFIMPDSSSRVDASDLFIPVWILPILFITCLVLTIGLLNVVRHKKYIKDMAFYDYAMESCTLKLQQLIDEKEQFNVKYVDAFPKLDLIPERYRNTTCLSSILGYLSDCRASIWKEAVNLYEDELKEAREREIIRWK